MFDVLFTDRVTVRRAVSRDVRNASVYEEVKGEDGGTLAIRCKLERRGRKIITTTGQETQSDATMLFRSSRAPSLSLEDLVRAGDATYRVVGLSSERVAGVEYSRADLTLDRTEVPEDVNAE